MSKEQPCHVPFQFSQVAHQINFNTQILAKKSLKMECKIAEISQNQRYLRKEIWMIKAKYYNRNILRQYTGEDNTNLWKGWNTDWDSHVYVRRYRGLKFIPLLSADNSHLTYACYYFCAAFRLVQDGDRIEDRVRPGMSFIIFLSFF